MTRYNKNFSDSAYETATNIDTEFQAVEDTQADMLSRKAGDTPNDMETDLDLGDNDILNGGSISSQRLFLAGNEVFSQVFQVDPNVQSQIDDNLESIQTNTVNIQTNTDDISELQNADYNLFDENLQITKDAPVVNLTNTNSASDSSVIFTDGVNEAEITYNASSDTLTVAGNTAALNFSETNLTSNVSIETPLTQASDPAATVTTKSYVDALVHTPITLSVDGGILSGFVIGRTYMATVYGVTRALGGQGGVFTMAGPAIREGNVVGSGTIIDSMPDTVVDWPDGAQQQTATFFFTAASNTINATTDNGAALAIRAVQLN